MLILHGKNIERSRRSLNEKIKIFSGEVIRFEGESLDLTQLKQTVESKPLFGGRRLIIIENLFSRRPSKEKEELLKYVRFNSPENLIIWENRTIDGRTLAPFTLARSERFELTTTIFKFLESLSPAKKKLSLILLHRCLTQETPEMVFYMLCRQVKDLIIVADLGEKGLDFLPTWKKAKLVSQAQKFGLKRLQILYRQLLQIDYQQKTGKTPLSLASQLDLLVASL